MEVETAVSDACGAKLIMTPLHCRRIGRLAQSAVLNRAARTLAGCAALFGSVWNWPV